MKIQIYSDIHLEFYKTFPKIDKKADVLILAGDIGRINITCFKTFFDYVSDKWVKIFYVLGNHEYYHSKKTYDKLNTSYKSFFRNYNNITLLDRDVELYEGVYFIGCTLWSIYSKDISRDYTNCLKMIKSVNGDNWKVSITKDIYNDFHYTDKKWLLDTLETLNLNNTQDNLKKYVIITHYPTTIEGTSHPKYKNEIYKEVFATNIEFKNPDIDNYCYYFVAGHTHYSYDFYDEEAGIYHISNQMGYKNEIIKGRTGFDASGCIRDI